MGAYLRGGGIYSRGYAYLRIYGITHTLSLELRDSILNFNICMYCELTLYVSYLLYLKSHFAHWKNLPFEQNVH